MLVQRIDVEHKATGIVVGVISKRGREIISYGRFDRNDPRVPDGETVFEIGSITKIFTALLLSDMALHKDVALNDPVARDLPASIRMPTRDGKQITMLDLATHYSGLPPEPAHSSAYPVDQMYEFLNQYQLTRDPERSSSTLILALGSGNKRRLDEPERTMRRCSGRVSPSRCK